MKALDGMYVTGSGGVLIAAVMWWIEAGGGALIREEASRLNREADPAAFTSKQEGELSDDLSKHSQVMQVDAAFWEAVRETPILRMIEIATEARDKDMAKTKSVVKDLIMRELAIALKATDFFARNRAAIEREKKRLKTVKAVMNA